MSKKHKKVTRDNSRKTFRNHLSEYREKVKWTELPKDKSDVKFTLQSGWVLTGLFIGKRFVLLNDKGHIDKSFKALEVVLWEYVKTQTFEEIDPKIVDLDKLAQGIEQRLVEKGDSLNES